MNATENPEQKSAPIGEFPKRQPGRSQPGFRPQSPPKSLRLSKGDMRDLMRLCDVEIQHCGLDQRAGRRALKLKEKLAGAKEDASRTLSPVPLRFGPFGPL
jgi:hypothetical protein